MSRMKSAGIPAGCYTKCVWPPRSRSGPGVLISSSQENFLHRTAAQRAQSAAPNRGWPAREGKKKACRFVRAVYIIVSPRAARPGKECRAHSPAHRPAAMYRTASFLSGSVPGLCSGWYGSRERTFRQGTQSRMLLQMVRNRIDRSSRSDQ